MNNEIKVLDIFFGEFEDKIPLDIDLLFNINNLKTKKEVLQWYIEFNSGGTQHTPDEIERVLVDVVAVHPLYSEVAYNIEIQFV